MPRKKLTIKNYFRESHLFMRRIIFLFFITITSCAALVARLAYLQISQHDIYTTLSNQNQLSLIPIEPNRGLIYDRNGILLAVNTPVFSLDIIPDRVPHLETTIKQLQQIISITSEDLKRFKKEASQHRKFQPISIKVKLTEEEVAKFSLHQYRFPGVKIKAGVIRHYPYGKEFVHVLGYVARINEQEMKKINQTNYSGSTTIGKLGIEKYYEKELHGIVGYQQEEVDASGRSVRTLKRFKPVPGDNIYISIDTRLQMAIEEIMRNEKGAVVVIKPKTGEILALVSYPAYDPNPFVIGIDPKQYKSLREDPEKPLYNRAIRGVYPFGSTIKPFYAIAGLDSGVIDTSYSIRDPGYFALPGLEHLYRDWRKGGHGVVNVAKAIVVSCDTFFYGLAVKLGINRMAKYLNKFGFGELTGIDILEELPGLVPTPQWKMRKWHSKWFTGDTVSAAIGQGYVLTTPLQLASGMAAIANRGVRYKPRLLLKVEKPDGNVEEIKPVSLPPIILESPRTWDVVIKALNTAATTPQGTAYAAFQNVPYAVAAKTGTAQLVKIVGENVHGGDAALPKHLRNNRLLIAFAPVENPQIAVAVLVENSTIAPLVARRVMDYYFYLNHQYFTSEPLKQVNEPANDRPGEDEDFQPFNQD